MKDKNLEPIIKKLEKYKDSNTLSNSNVSKINKVIELLNTISPSRISIPNISMADSTKAQMIKFFYDKYFSTNQDAEEFSEEFYFVVGEISIGMVPIKLEYLTGFLEELVDVFSEFKFGEYKEVKDLIIEEKMVQAF